MKLRQWMSIDLGALIRGRVVVVEAPPMAPGVKRSLWKRLLSGWFRRRNTARELILVTDQLRQLVVCQAPLADGLKHAATDCPNFRVSAHLYRLALALEQGGTLAEGLRQFPAFCPRYYVDLVAAAETSGHLNETLLELSRDLEEYLKTSHTLRNRTVYILVLLSYALAVGTFLQAKVFPVLEDVGTELGGSSGGEAGFWKVIVGYLEFLSNAITTLAKESSEVLGYLLNRAAHGVLDGMGSPYLPVPLIIAALLVVPLTIIVLSRFLRRPAMFVFSRLPVIRRAAFYARWSHALKIISLLLDRGIPLDGALESAAGSDMDPATRRVLRRMSEGTRAGLSFSEVLDRERRRVPRSATGAVAFGERTGGLPELLSRLSHLYQLRAERTLRVLLDISFPLAIIGCGLLISTIDIRFFTLMTNMVYGYMCSM